MWLKSPRVRFKEFKIKYKFGLFLSKKADFIVGFLFKNLCCLNFFRKAIILYN